MSSRNRSRRLVQLATGIKDAEEGESSGIREEKSPASDLDETQESIAKQMAEIISNIFENVDSDIPESDSESQFNLPEPTRRVSESSDSESALFGSDYSDVDPTYFPETERQRSPSTNSESDDLITLEDLIGFKYSENAQRLIPSPRPGTKLQQDTNDEKDPESAMRKNIPPLVSSPEPSTSHQREYINNDEASELAMLENVPSFVMSPQPSTSHQRKEIDNDDRAIYEMATLILTDVLDLVWGQVKTLNRWRTANPNNWKKNVAKKRRAEGLSYITNNQIRAPKVPKTIDCAKCTFKCTDAFTEQDRAKICRTYWNLDFASSKNFILSRVTIQPPKRVVVERKRTARPFTTKCFFDVDKDRRQVCQKFFCSTLGISPSVLNDAVKHRDELGLFSGADSRGHHIPPNKTPPAKVEEVVNHIKSFPVMEAHYVRNQSKRKYLDATLSVNKMYELYLEKYGNNNPVSVITYRRIFSTQFNLSFFVPKKDQCQKCNKYISEAKSNTQRQTDQKSYDEHIQRKIACAAEKEKDKIRAGSDKSFLSVSFDLQAILQIPCSKIGLLYYVRKLTMYNLTIYESALPNNAFCFCWSETHGKKGSAEIGTILYHYLSNCISTDVTSVSLFSDTCGGQNRNQNVAAILLWAVNNIDHLQVIKQKFLESGHSYMEADAMHSSIESAKKNKDVFSMTDWKNIFKDARSKGVYKVGNKKVKKSPYHVKEFKYNEFYDLKQLAEATLKNRTKDCNGDKINWLKIKKLKFVKDDPKIYFNYDVSENYLNFDTKAVPASRKTATPQSGPRYSTRIGKRRDKSNPNSVEPPATPEIALPCLQLEQLYNKPLPISAAKKKDLISLCEKGVIPEEYHGWFRTLNSDTNIIDRVPDVAESESSSDEDDS